jgi:hypothetical protein
MEVTGPAPWSSTTGCNHRQTAGVQRLQACQYQAWVTAVALGGSRAMSDN